MRCLLLLALLWGGVVRGAEPLTPAAYHTRLDELSSALAAGDQVRAETIAEAIAATQVAWPGGISAGDPTLIALVRAGPPEKAGRAVAALAGEVVRLRGGGAPAAKLPDAAALAALAAAARAERLRRGGEVLGNPIVGDALPPSLRDRLVSALLWCGNRIHDLWHWLKGLFGGAEDDHGGAQSGVPVVTFLVVGLLVVLATVLALAVWRRRAPPAPALAGALQPAQTDTDPRSRAADEWVAFARELSRQGRHREAVRAWYHALLVDCWSHGVLHYRIGRTNWEYALALSGELTWRGGFHELTRAFDRAWYGGQEDAETAGTFAVDAQAMLGRLRAPGGRP